MAKRKSRFPSYGLVRGASHAQGGVDGMVAGEQPVELEGGEWIIPKEAVPDYLPVLKQITNEGRAMQQMQNGNTAMDALIASATMETGLIQPKSPMYQGGGSMNSYENGGEIGGMDLKNFMSRIYGKNPEITTEGMKDMMGRIAFHESAGTMNPLIKQKSNVLNEEGEVVGSKEGPGRGLFQFEKTFKNPETGEYGQASGMTARNRLANQLKNYYGDKAVIPKWLTQKGMENPEIGFDASRLTDEQQKMLFLGNMLQHPDANMGEVISGGRDLADFWQKYHQAGGEDVRDERIAAFGESMGSYPPDSRRGGPIYGYQKGGEVSGLDALSAMASLLERQKAAQPVLRDGALQAPVYTYPEGHEYAGLEYSVAPPTEHEEFSVRELARKENENALRASYGLKPKYQTGGQIQLRKQQEMRNPANIDSALKQIMMRGVNQATGNGTASAVLDSMKMQRGGMAEGPQLMQDMSQDRRIKPLQPDRYLMKDNVPGGAAQQEMSVPKLNSAYLGTLGIETPLSKRQGALLSERGIPPQQMAPHLQSLVGRALIQRLTNEPT